MSGVQLFNVFVSWNLTHVPVQLSWFSKVKHIFMKTKEVSNGVGQNSRLNTLQYIHLDLS